MKPDEMKYLIKMRETAALPWKTIALVLDRTDANCRKAYSNHKQIEGLPPKPLLPKYGKITASIGVKLKKYLIENPKTSYRKLQGWLRQTEGVDINFNIIRRFFKKNDWIAIPMSYKIPLRPINRQKRLSFAKMYVEDMDSLDRIMWSDETSVTAYPTGRKIIIKVHSSTKETDLPFIPKVQKGGFSVMFWGCFTRYAKGPLTVVEGTIDGPKYLQLVQDIIIPEINASEHDLIFMQDNARPHK